MRISESEGELRLSVMSAAGPIEVDLRALQFHIIQVHLRIVLLT